MTAWHVRGIPVRGWGVALIKTGQDRTAKANLEAQGVRCFMPKVRHAGRSGRLEPLFPGYLFFQVPKAAWGFVRNTRGVRDVIWAGDRPGLVRPEAMRALLKALNDEDFIDMRPEPPPKLASEPLSPGESVQITMGVFKNFAAVYKALAPADRIRVVTDFMGQATEIELDRHAIVRNPGGQGPAGAVATKQQGQGNGMAAKPKRNRRPAR